MLDKHEFQSGVSNCGVVRWTDRQKVRLLRAMKNHGEGVTVRGHLGVPPNLEIYSVLPLFNPWGTWGCFTQGDSFLVGAARGVLVQGFQCLGPPDRSATQLAPDSLIDPRDPGAELDARCFGGEVTGQQPGTDPLPVCSLEFIVSCFEPDLKPPLG